MLSTGQGVTIGDTKLPFADRAAAGRALVPLLTEVLDRWVEDGVGQAVVLALPRGGVPVAAEAATALEAPLDVLVVRKLGMPWQPELAIGALAIGAQPDKPVKVLNEALLERAGLPEDVLDTVVERAVAELHRREQAYRGERPAVDVTGRVAVLVDDGLATGASARAALLALRMRQPDRVVLAVPVGPRSTLIELTDVADHVVCAAVPRRFGAVGRHYVNFGQVSDAEVRRLLSNGRA
jgi:putative phosphoribosyl transferase